MLTFSIILLGMFLTGGVALYIARNVEHGEARFGPDGKLLPDDLPVKEKTDIRVTKKRGDRQDGNTND